MDFRKARKLKKIIITKFKKIASAVKTRFTNHLWISLGENCLTDNILQRYNLKSFSTPYSHGRSNLDYALQLERIKYNKLLDSVNLNYGFIDEKDVVRSTMIKRSDNIYHEVQMNGFEFTHHDIIKSDKAKNSLKRKIKILQRYKGIKDYIFFYHYRLNQNLSKDKIVEKAQEFSAFYKLNNRQCFLIIFTQKIVDNENQRGIYYSKAANNIHFFELRTIHHWAGNDQDIFWARVDDDLIKKMISTTKNIVLKRKEFFDGLL